MGRRPGDGGGHDHIASWLDTAEMRMRKEEEDDRSASSLECMNRREERAEMGGPQKMQWHAGHSRFFYSPKGYYFVGLEDGTSIEVHPDIYDQRFGEYLERIGVKLLMIKINDDANYRIYSELVRMVL